ncbi:ABC transporter permease [Pseudonocardia nematodicida]|uniref:Oligopeptide transport system permease protein OppC n=1 Tax=Pseudonocardia nematodicida TaxID=1206997 RepID=A0ABV1KKM1_9PSEU
MSTGIPDLTPAVGVDAPVATRRRTSRAALIWRRFRRNTAAMAGLVVLTLLTLFALLGDAFWAYDYTDVDFTALSQAPSAEHPLGTTAGGNDVYAQAVHGLRRSMLIAAFVSVVTTLVAAAIGAGAAYMGGFGGRLGLRGERALIGLIHFLLVIPTFLVLALLTQSAGGDWRVLAVALAAVSWMTTARITWTIATSLREREYVAAARYMGVPGWRIVSRHIIPNISSMLIVSFTIQLVVTVQAETALSYLGLGIQIPDVSLGVLLAEGGNSMTTLPWVFWAPTVLLLFLTISIALIGDGLRDALDPTSNSGGRA